MAELVDALVSGTSGGNIVGVRVPFWAPNLRASFSVGRFLFQGAKPLSRRSPTRAERQSIARANRWRYPEPTRVLGATEMIKKSRYSYSDTIAQLSKTITDAGNTIFATIDQSAA